MHGGFDDFDGVPGGAGRTGGDFYYSPEIHYKEYHQYTDDGDFSKLKVGDDWLFAGASPPLVESLQSALLDRRVLLLGGPDLRGKGCMARHTAQRAIDPQGSDGRPWHGRQRRCGPEVFDLDKALHAAEEPTLFLLRGAHPYHLEHNLQRVVNWLTGGRHYLLVTTDTSSGAWGLEVASNLRHLWWQPEIREVYPADYLAHLVGYCVDRKAEGAVPGELFPEGRPRSASEWAECPLVAGLGLGEVVAALETPDDVVSLAGHLCEPTSLLEANAIRKHLRGLLGDRSVIEGWYRSQNQKAQLLASGLSFFDGLQDDQTFSALDLLVEKGWRRRHPMLGAFDYHDLDAVDQFFRWPRASVQGGIVECRREEIRRSLLRVSWLVRRREMMAVLPVVTELIRRAGRKDLDRDRRLGSALVAAKLLEGLVATAPSQGETAPSTGAPGGGEAPEDREEGTPRDAEDGVSPGEPEGSAAANVALLPISRKFPYGPERELLGLVTRRHQLYGVVARSLSEIGQMSPYAVERSLYELAGEPSRQAQGVAAGVLRSWFGTRQEAFSFQKLKEWLAEGSGVAPGQKRAAAFSDFVQQTVARTVFFTLLYCPRNSVYADAVELLRRLAADTPRRGRSYHPVVRHQVRTFVVPAAAQWHRRQLDPDLREFVTREPLVEPVAVGWARSLLVDPEAGLELLRSWRELEQEPELEEDRQSRLDSRQATVAAVYGAVDYHHERAPLTLREGALALAGLRDEALPRTRRFALAAVERLIVRYRDHALRALRDDWIDGLEVVDRAWVLRPLGLLQYWHRLEQAAEEDSAAPTQWKVLTDPDSISRSVVEETMRDWVGDESSPVAQQVAFAALVNVEGARSEEGGSRRPVVDVRIHSPAVGRGERLRRSPWLARFILWCLTSFSPHRRRMLTAPLAEAIFQLRWKAPAVRRLLSLWRLERGTSVGVLGRWLSLTLRLYQRRKPVGALVLLLLALGFVLLITAGWVGWLTR